MAYVYWSFDGVRLPLYNSESEQGTPTLQGTLVPTIGGLVDTLGDGIRRMTQVQVLTMQGVYAGDLAGEPGNHSLQVENGEDLQVYATRALAVELYTNAIEDEYTALVKKLGVRGALVLRDPVTGLTKSKTARLLRVGRAQNVNQRTLYIEVSCMFETAQQEWA